MELNWQGLKQELDNIYQHDNNSKYANLDQLDLIDLYLKPKIENLKLLLLEEDLQGSIGECMEYTIRNNVFFEMVALA